MLRARLWRCRHFEREAGRFDYSIRRLAELARDVRPPDYATAFVRQANELSGLEQPIFVCCADRPEWLEAVLQEPGVLETPLSSALTTCQAQRQNDPEAC